MANIRDDEIEEVLEVVAKIEEELPQDVIVGERIEKTFRPVRHWLLSGDLLKKLFSFSSGEEVKQIPELVNHPYLYRKIIGYLRCLQGVFSCQNYCREVITPVIRKKTHFRAFYPGKNPVAVKFTLPQKRQKSLVEEYERAIEQAELGLTAQPELYSYGEVDGYVYYAEEMIQGRRTSLERDGNKIVEFLENEYSKLYEERDVEFKPLSEFEKLNLDVELIDWGLRQVVWSDQWPEREELLERYEEIREADKPVPWVRGHGELSQKHLLLDNEGKIRMIDLSGKRHPLIYDQRNFIARFPACWEWLKDTLKEFNSRNEKTLPVAEQLLVGSLLGVSRYAKKYRQYRDKSLMLSIGGRMRNSKKLIEAVEKCCGLQLSCIRKREVI